MPLVAALVLFYANRGEPGKRDKYHSVVASHHLVISRILGVIAHLLTVCHFSGKALAQFEQVVVVKIGQVHAYPPYFTMPRAYRTMRHLSSVNLGGAV